MGSPRGHKGDSESVKVAVRCRPFNPREEAGCLIPVVSMSSQDKTVTIRSIGGAKKPEGTGTSMFTLAAAGQGQTFQFDFVFWSMSEPDADGNPPYSQQDVYCDIGKPLVRHSYCGFNSCLFAYGQTGSGKTFTMMGGPQNTPDDRGVIPRLCCDIFEQKAEIEKDGAIKWEVSVGFIEVYNERVSDLLASRTKGKSDMFVEIRENPKTGIYIENQAKKIVKDYDDVLALIDAGNAVRHVAATKMNARSSRSHAIFQLFLKETCTVQSGAKIVSADGKSCRLNLVDLAGSERVAQSQVEGEHFDEAKFINLSLTTLGRVIDILADMGKNVNSVFKKPPYRESKLTFLLKDSLGGNSKTFMMAAVSPSDLNSEESLGTLRYASRARQIVNTAKINEDPKTRKIRELEEQISNMRGMLTGADPAFTMELKEQLDIMQRESRQRAAEIESLQLEKQRADMTERMLNATEAEKAQLMKQREQLERDAQSLREESEQFRSEVAALRQAQNKQQQELIEQQKKHEQQLREMQTKLASAEDARQHQLQSTMAELSSVQEDKDGALRGLAIKQNEIQELMKQTSMKDEDKQRLAEQKQQLETQVRQITENAERNERVLAELRGMKAAMEEAATVMQRALLDSNRRILEQDETQRRQAIELSISNERERLVKSMFLRLLTAKHSSQVDEANTFQKKLDDTRVQLQDLLAEKRRERRQTIARARGMTKAVTTGQRQQDVPVQEDLPVELPPVSEVHADPYLAIADEEPHEDVKALDSEEEDFDEVKPEDMNEFMLEEKGLLEPWKIPLREICNPQFLKEQFAVTKITPGLLSEKHDERIWVVDHFARMFFNLDPNGKLKKKHPAAMLLQIEKDIAHDRKLRLTFYDANHSNDLIFKDAVDRERFYEAAQAMRPSVRVFCPDLTNHNPELLTVATIDANAANAMTLDITDRDPSGKLVKRQLVGECKINASMIATEHLTVWVGTACLEGGRPPRASRLTNWIPKNKFDIYAVALQGASKIDEKDWLEQLVDWHVGKEYLTIATMAGGADTHLAIICRRKHLLKIANCQGSKSIQPGKKGGLAISLKFLETSLCFVALDLPGPAESDATRMSILSDVLSQLQVGHTCCDALSQFHHVFILGHLNFSSSAKIHEAVQLSASRKYFELLEYDTLTKVMMGGKFLPGFRETPVTFGPTFFPAAIPMKHAPSYSDRVLFKSLKCAQGIKCTSYAAHPSLQDTQREYHPVSATFVLCAVRPVVSCFMAPQEPLPMFTFEKITFEAAPSSAVTSISQPQLWMVSTFTRQTKPIDGTIDHERNKIVWSGDALSKCISLNHVQEYLETQSFAFALRDSGEKVDKAFHGSAQLPMSGMICGRQDVPQSFSITVSARGNAVGKLEGSFTWTAAAK